MKTWAIIGRLCFWLGWPVIYVNLRFGWRTRVLVVCDHEVLVLRQWLGDGKWCLPGGGLRWREQPLAGALRELREETGLAVDDLQSLGTKRVNQAGLGLSTMRLP